MRWWLALAFVLIAMLTAFATAQLFSLRYESALRDEAESIAIGRAVDAGSAIEDASEDGRLDRNPADVIQRIAERRRIAVWVYTFSGGLVTPPKSLGIDERERPEPRRGAAGGARRHGRRHRAAQLHLHGRGHRGRRSSASPSATPTRRPWSPTPRARRSSR